MMQRRLWRDGAAAAGLAGLGLAGVGCVHPSEAVAIYPLYAYEDGCTEASLTGVGFVEDGFKVLVDGQEAPVTWPDKTRTDEETGDETDNPDYGYEVAVTMPGHAAGQVSIEVENAGKKHEIGTGFWYVPCDNGMRIDAAYLVDAEFNALDYATRAGGETLVLAGCGLGPNTEVWIGDQLAPIAYSECTTLVLATIPTLPDDAAWGTYPVTITNPDTGASNSDAVVDYNCDAPTLSGVDPMYLDQAGGTALAWGCGFYDDGVVHSMAFIDAADPENAPWEGTPIDTMVWDPYTLELTFPAHDPGPVALSVVNPDPADVTGGTPLSWATLPDALTYVVSTAIFALAPDTGDAGGGYPVTVYGAGFDAESTVWWDGVALDALAFTVDDPGTLTVASAPAAAGGGAQAVTVSVAHPTSGQADATFYYINP